MLPDNFNKDFTKAFTQHCILYSAIEEYRHGNLLFMQFAGNAQEMKPIAISVANNMYQGKLASRIIKELADKSIPQLGLLCSTTNILIEEFNSYINHELYTSGYCQELVHILQSFNELVNGLNTEIEGRVSNKLQDIHTSIYNVDRHDDIDVFYLYEIIEQIEFYLKNLLTYYYHFLIVKEQENVKCKGIGLTTQVADLLGELIGAIEMVSNNMEDLLNMLLTWEVCMEKYEELALYN